MRRLSMSEFRTVAMFEIFDFQTVVHAECAGMFMIYLRTRFHMSTIIGPANPTSCLGGVS
jgi:hypothetical protein